MTTVMTRETLLEKKYLHFCYYLRLSHFVRVLQCWRLSALSLDWYARPWYVQGVITTANMVMARSCFAEDGKELS